MGEPQQQLGSDYYKSAADMIEFIAAMTCSDSCRRQLLDTAARYRVMAKEAVLEAAE